MKKTSILVLAFLFFALAGFPQGLDVVVMVDVSESMFPVFDDLVNYLLRDLLENRLHRGDTFHLLSFADSAETEVENEIEDRADLAAVIDRILLLRPLGQYTDLVGAVEYLYDYTRSLSEQNRKLVLLLTDGIHDPPPGSANAVDSEQALARLLESASRIRREGWDIHILRMPRTTPDSAASASQREESAAGQTEPAGGELFQSLIRELQADVVAFDQVEREELTDQLTGFSSLEFPGFLGEVRRSVRAPFLISNFSDSPLSWTLIEVESDGRSLLKHPVSLVVPPNQTAELSAALRLPRGIPDGRQRLAVRLGFENQAQRISPLEGELDFTKVSLAGYLRRVPSDYLLYGFLALLLIALILALALFVRRRLQEASFTRFFDGVAERRKGRLSIRPLIMKVDTQNPNIGARNIHRVPPGSRLSVGGDGSAFLIYYLPVPRCIGYIRNDGKKYIFTPKKPEHFPPLQEPIRDCLGKPIRAISSQGREVVFHFSEYISPLEQLNMLMRSVPKFHIDDVPLKGVRKEDS